MMKAFTFSVLLLLCDRIASNKEQIKYSNSTGKANILNSSEEKVATLIFMGDISFHGVIMYHVDKGNCTYNESFEKIKPHVKDDADYIIANLDSVIKRKQNTSELDPNEIVHIYSREESYSALKYLGVDTVSIANNHLLDYGAESATYTYHALKKLPIGVSGMTFGKGPMHRQKPYVFSINGIKFGMVSYCDNEDGCLGPRNVSSAGPAILLQGKRYQPMVRKDLRYLRRVENVDVIILYIHWMREYQELPGSIYESDKMRFFIDMGIDMIIGSHAHLTSFHYLSKGQLLVPSLGNFLFPMHLTHSDGIFGDNNVTKTKDDDFYRVMKNMNNPSKHAEMIKVRVTKTGVDSVEYMRTKIDITEQHCLQVVSTSKWKTLCDDDDTDCLGCLDAKDC